MQRTSLAVANWKMNGTLAAARAARAGLSQKIAEACEISH